MYILAAFDHFPIFTQSINFYIFYIYTIVTYYFLSTWVKNKENPLDSLEKRTNIKRQNLRTGNFEMVIKAIFN